MELYVKMNRNKRTKETIKQGIVGGFLGACVGFPGLGILLGVGNANKDKIKKATKDFVKRE